MVNFALSLKKKKKLMVQMQIRDFAETYTIQKILMLEVCTFFKPQGETMLPQGTYAFIGSFFVGIMHFLSFMFVDLQLQF